MKLIGLTGGVGSGKSTIANMLEQQFHAYVIYTDEVAKELMKKDQICYKQVVEEFGPTILSDNQEIDRGKLAAIVFGDEKKLKRLNELTHPAVKQFVFDLVEKVKKQNKHTMIVIETALLIEANYAPLCDEVWYVYVPEAIRAERLKISRNYSNEKIAAIFDKQMKEMEFRACASFVIDNSKSMESIKQQIEQKLL